MKNHTKFSVCVSFSRVLALTAILFFNTYIYAQKPLEGKTILAVFAHPDDEGTVAPILAKYVREGAKVHLVTVTDGRFGSNEFNNYLEDEPLVAVRKEEMKCSAAVLGAELTHLDYEDQLKSAEGYDGHIPQVQGIIKDLYAIFEKVQPDVVITWGPDGWSNHIDHRLVGVSVTQVFTAKVWKKPSSLFYFGIPSDQIDNPEDKILYGQDRKYLTTKIAFTEDDFEKAYESFKCHKSQIDPEWKKKDLKKNWYRNDMHIYLRKFESPRTSSNSIFK